MRRARALDLGATVLAASLLFPEGVTGQPGGDPPPPFEEVDAGVDFVHFNGMSGELYFNEMMGAGVALFDYDGDGDQDIYLVQGTMLGEREPSQATFPPRHPLPLTDRLYRNDSLPAADGDPALRFVDVTAAAGLRPSSYGMGVASADYDSDGWVDLYVTSDGPNRLLRNRGDGTFIDVTAAAGVAEPRWSVPATFFDLDGDGWLDLFVGNYVRFSLETPGRCSTQTGAPQYCGPLAYRSESDRLWRNRGDGTFVDISRTSRIAERYGAALGVVATDLDADGRTDLYVANDLSANQLWLNQGDGSLRDEGLLAGAAVNWEGDSEASMGVQADDLDGDGDPDLVLTHLDSQTHTLYGNDGRGNFRDVTRESGLGAASWSVTGFGVASIDFDGDGRLDLFIANGAVRTLPELVAAGEPHPLHQRNQLFRGLGGGRFEEVTSAPGVWLSRSEVSRGVAQGDLDNDGDADLVVSNNAGPVRIGRNRAADGAGWLGLRLLAGAGKADLPGVRVSAQAPSGERLERRTRTDSSYASASDPRVLIGLGDRDGAGEVSIDWPGGRRVRLTRPPRDTYLTLLPPTDRR